MAHKKKTVSDLVGKSWMYKMEIYKVESYQAGGGRVIIKSDKDNLIFGIDKLEAELEKFLPVSEEKKNTSVKIENAIIGSGAIPPLKDVLLTTIAKVQTDSKYIPQANAINSSVNTLINIAKLELQIIKHNG